MSVADTFLSLPPWIIPARLQHVAPEARGSNQLFIWRFGTGSFVDGPVSSDLSFVVDKPTHGCVQLAHAMALAAYQAALASTAADWTVDEPAPPTPTALVPPGGATS